MAVSASIVNDIAVRIANGKKYLASQQAKGNSQTAAGASAKIEQYEDQLQIAQAQRYIQSQEAKGNSETVAGATAKLAEYNEDYDEKYNSGTPEEANPEDDAGAEEEETVKTDELTGNAPLDKANMLSNILNSPLYTEAIKNAYLADYIPGLNQSSATIQAKRTAEVQNSVLRQQAQRRAVRNVAGDYAARGLRTPKMISEGIEPIQQSTERAKTAAQAEISGLEESQGILYGANAAGDEGSFVTNPAAFGAIGANARRAAVGGLQSQPQNYGLTQVANAATAPKELMQEPETAGTSGGGRTREQIEASIAAADRYIGNQETAGNQRFVTGGKKKRQTYMDELSALG